MERFKIQGVSHFLDGFFVGRGCSNECANALNTFLCLADSIGVPIKSEKNEQPTTCLTILSIEIDSSAMVAR